MRVIWVALLCSCSRPSGPPVELEEKIDRWMARHAVDRTALLANRCGEPWIEVRRNAPKGTVFALASSSKWLTAGAVLAASDRGIVDLDQPVSDWIVELESPRRQATLRQLLGHRSGYAGLHPCQDGAEVSLQTCARWIDRQPGGRPGTQFRYSNTGFAMAAAAVERAANRPFTEVFDEVLVQPMGWQATSYGEQGRAGNPNAAYGLESTAAEYLAFTQMILDEGRGPDGPVLSDEAIDAMWTGALVPRTGFAPPSLRGVPFPIYGLGMWLEQHDDEGVPSIGSAQGRYGFQPWVDRKHRIAAVFAVELGGPGNPDERSSPPQVKQELAALARELPPCSVSP